MQTEGGHTSHGISGRSGGVFGHAVDATYRRRPSNRHSVRAEQLPSKLCSRTTEALGAAVGARGYGQWGTEATRGDIETRRKHAYAPRCSYPSNAAGLSLWQRFSDRCRSGQNTPRTETRCLKDVDKTNRWPRTEAGSSAAILGRAEAFLAVLTHNTPMIQIPRYASQGRPDQTEKCGCLVRR